MVQGWPARSYARNLSPNIGSPLLDCAREASSCSTSQCSASTKPNIATFFESALSYSFKEPKFESFIHETEFENLDIIPSHADLDSLTSKLESRHKIYKLRDALKDLDGYDAVYIDTPPAMNGPTQAK